MEGVNYTFPKGIMKHSVIQDLKAVSGDKSLLRQWHQTVTTALQFKEPCVEIVHSLAEEIENRLR